MGGGSGGGGNGGRTGGGGGDVETMTYEQLNAYIDKHTTEIWSKDASGNVLRDANGRGIQNPNLAAERAVNGPLRNAAVDARYRRFLNTDAMQKQASAESDRAKSLRDNGRVPRKQTSTEKRRQWEMDHPL